MNKTFKQLTSFALAFAMMLTLVTPAFAAAPQNASDNMTRQKISEASDHVITFTLPTALAASGTIDLTFPVGFTGTAATVSTDWAANGSNAVQYTSAAGDAAATVYSVTVTGMINPVGAGNQVITIASSNLDAGEITVPIVLDDQIVVTAKVDQTLFFDVRDGSGTPNTATDNAVQFGSLTSGAVRYGTDAGTGSATAGAASQFEIGTNATNGYFVDVTGDTLRSFEDISVVIDPLLTPAAAPAFGTEAFGIEISLTTASAPTAADLVSNPTLTSGVVDVDYDGLYHHPGVANEVDVVATNVGPATNELYEVEYLANISPLTEAGNYATFFTFTATALY
jgi:hypothetical protein